MTPFVTMARIPLHTVISASHSLSGRTLPVELIEQIKSPSTWDPTGRTVAPGYEYYLGVRQDKTAALVIVYFGGMHENDWAVSHLSAVGTL